MHGNAGAWVGKSDVDGSILDALEGALLGGEMVSSAMTRVKGIEYHLVRPCITFPELSCLHSGFVRAFTTWLIGSTDGATGPSG
mmetsp:Transcript_20044/g.29308  ORF Transcript_20044/g.29308 Transcript_20044/m.29308 type:complete len:84 (+) Transcript_20044:415-666(+)